METIILPLRIFLNNFNRNGMPCCATAADTPFLTYEWQKTWNDCLCSCEGELHLLTVRDGGALLGIAPLFVVPEPDKDGKHSAFIALDRQRGRIWTISI
jgi:hypothetical protein